MGGIKASLVFPMAALHFSVMSWGIRVDELVGDPVLLQMLLEKGKLIPVRGETVCKYRAVIGLDAFDPVRESLYQVIHKTGSAVGVVLVKSFYKTPAGIPVNGSKLVERLGNGLWVL